MLMVLSLSVYKIFPLIYDTRSLGALQNWNRFGSPKKLPTLTGIETAVFAFWLATGIHGELYSAVLDHQIFCHSAK